MAKTRSVLTIMTSLFVISVPLNFVWELAQMPFYIEGGYLLEFARHCIVPSLGDGVLVLIIFGVGWGVWRRADWFVHPGAFPYALMLATGLLIAVLIEWVAVYGLGRWSYTARMPVLPVLQVGLLPVLQMLVLPPVIFRAAAWWLERRPS
jgi:hypothetical protein